MAPEGGSGDSNPVFQTRFLKTGFEMYVGHAVVSHSETASNLYENLESAPPEVIPFKGPIALPSRTPCCY